MEPRHRIFMINIKQAPVFAANSGYFHFVLLLYEVSGVLHREAGLSAERSASYHTFIKIRYFCFYLAWAGDTNIIQLSLMPENYILSSSYAEEESRKLCPFTNRQLIFKYPN